MMLEFPKNFSQPTNRRIFLELLLIVGEIVPFDYKEEWQIRLKVKRASFSNIRPKMHGVRKLKNDARTNANYVSRKHILVLNQFCSENDKGLLIRNEVIRVKQSKQVEWKVKYLQRIMKAVKEKIFVEGTTHRIIMYTSKKRNEMLTQS